MFPCISLFTALLLTQTGSAEPFPFFEPVKPPRPVQVMVHRGANRYAPENTLPAIALAVELGAVDAAWPSLSKDFGFKKATGRSPSFRQKQNHKSIKP